MGIRKNLAGLPVFDPLVAIQRSKIAQWNNKEKMHISGFDTERLQIYTEHQSPLQSFCNTEKVD